ncbi:MAG: hypothetical protein QMB51_00035 [Patescibacteria group bacterium]
MSSSAKRYKKTECCFIPSMKNYNDCFGNSYDIIYIKKRRNKIVSAQLRSKTEITISGYNFKLKHGQIITFHPNNTLKSFYAENLQIYSMSFQSAKIYIGNNGKIKTIVSENTKIKIINRNGEQYLSVEYFPKKRKRNKNKTHSKYFV